MVTDVNLRFNLRRSPGKKNDFVTESGEVGKFCRAPWSVEDCEALHFKDTRAAEGSLGRWKRFPGTDNILLCFSFNVSKTSWNKRLSEINRELDGGNCLHLDSDKSQDLASAQFVSSSLNFDKSIRCGCGTWPTVFWVKHVYFQTLWRFMMMSDIFISPTLTSEITLKNIIINKCKKSHISTYNQDDIFCYLMKLKWNWNLGPLCHIYLQTKRLHAFSSGACITIFFFLLALVPRLFWNAA